VGSTWQPKILEWIGYLMVEVEADEFTCVLLEYAAVNLKRIFLAYIMQP
jgi:hypothetical protein